MKLCAPCGVMRAAKLTVRPRKVEQRLVPIIESDAIRMVVTDKSPTRITA
jgi:hypothetical protein